VSRQATVYVSRMAMAEVMVTTWQPSTVPVHRVWQNAEERIVRRMEER